MSEDVLMFIALTTGVVLVVGHVVRFLRLSSVQRTIREAMMTNNPLAGELLERIDQPDPAGSGDDRTGLILLALGAALACYGLLQGQPELIREFVGVALFPIFVGAVLLARHAVINRGKADRS